jgi:hypothetical protein
MRPKRPNTSRRVIDVAGKLYKPALLVQGVEFAADELDYASDLKMK